MGSGEFFTDVSGKRVELPKPMSEVRLEHRSSNALGRARELYTEGRRFIVIKPGARFEGILAFGEKGWAGWSRPLRLNDIITCTGWREGMAQNGMDEVNWTSPVVPVEAQWCQVWPMSGLFRPWPLDGYLQPMADHEEHGEVVDLTGVS